MWRTVKKRVRAAYNRAVNVPVNVVIIAREANEYERKPSGEMKVIGVKPEADQSTLYVADLILRLTRENGKHVALVEKNRYGMAIPEAPPARFELTKEKPLIAWLAPIMALVNEGEAVDHGDEEQAVAVAVERIRAAEQAPLCNGAFAHPEPQRSVR